MGGAVPLSNETPKRRATRLALGVSIAFLVSQLGAWPVAHIAPVAAVALLVDTRALSYGEGWRVFRLAVINFFLGGIIAWLLAPWPAILALTCGLVLFRFARYLLSANEHLLVIVSALIGFVVVPIIVVLLPAVGFIAATGLSLDWAVALITAWITWLIMPRKATLPEAHESSPLTPELTRELAWTLTLVLWPLLVFFMASSYTGILVAVYSVLIATTFSSAGGHQSLKSYAISNGIYSAVGLLIVYELLVMVPDVTFMVPLIFIAVYAFAVPMFRGGPTAGYWESGIFGFLIMLGAILMKDDIVVAKTLVGRLWQILLAGVYVIFALSVIEWIRSFRGRREASASTEATIPDLKPEGSHE